MTTILLLLTGLAAGLASGLLGIGGGIIIVPSLVAILGCTHHRAVGTSLFVLLLPVGLGAVLEYHRARNLDMAAGALVAAGLVLGAWISARIAQGTSEGALRLIFGVFLIVAGVKMTAEAYRSVRTADETAIQPAAQSDDAPRR